MSLLIIKLSRNYYFTDGEVDVVILYIAKYCNNTSRNYYFTDGEVDHKVEGIILAIISLEITTSPMVKWIAYI